MQTAQRTPTQRVIARRIAIARKTSARNAATAPDMVRVHLLGGFDPFSPYRRPANSYVDVARAEISRNGQILTLGDRTVDLSDEDAPLDRAEIVEMAPLAGTVLSEARASFDRNVLRLEETSRMFHDNGLCVGQDGERPVIESVTDGSVISTDHDVVLNGEDGPVSLFAWAEVAMVSGTDESTEMGLHDYTPLRVFLVGGAVIEIHGRVAWECFA